MKHMKTTTKAERFEAEFSWLKTLTERYEEANKENNDGMMRHYMQEILRSERELNKLR